MEDIILQELDKRIRDCEVNMGKVDVVLEKNAEVMTKFSDTLDSVRDAMVEMAANIAKTEQSNEKLQHGVEKLNGKFESLEEQVNLNENKSKIDILVWIRDNWFPIVIAVGTLSLVVYKLQ